MASISIYNKTKTKTTYRIRTFANNKIYSKNVTLPNNWSKKSVEKELNIIAAEFKDECTDKPLEIKTLKEYCDEYFIPKKELETAEKTQEYYKNILKHIIPELGNKNIDSITPIQVSAFLSRKQKHGTSKSLLHGIYVTLNQIFKDAYRLQMTSKNIMELVDLPKYKKELKKEIQTLSLDQVKLVIKALDTEPLKWKAYTRLSIDTGARKGEILGLKWKCVDFANNTISIENNLLYTRDKGIYEDTPKTKTSIRTIDVDLNVMLLLKELRKEQEKNIKIAKIELSKDRFVFTQDGISEPMHPSSPNIFCNRLSKKVGIKITPHKLRHTFASISILNGADIASVSEKLGHASKSITMDMYTHSNPEAIKRAGDIFRQAIQ